MSLTVTCLYAALASPLSFLSARGRLEAGCCAARGATRPSRTSTVAFALFLVVDPFVGGPLVPVLAGAQNPARKVAGCNVVVLHRGRVFLWLAVPHPHFPHPPASWRPDAAWPRRWVPMAGVSRPPPAPLHLCGVHHLILLRPLTLTLTSTCSLAWLQVWICNFPPLSCGSRAPRLPMAAFPWVLAAWSLLNDGGGLDGAVPKKEH
jgi:hypothetical protein